MTEELKTVVTIKQEPEPDPLDVKSPNGECLNQKVEIEIETKNVYKRDIETKDLYEAHEIKQEMAIGSEILQPHLYENKKHPEEIGENLKQNIDKYKYSVRDCISETLYLCEFCHEYFTALKLEEHIAIEHGKEMKLSCVDCMRDFIPKDGAKTIMCEDCSTKPVKVNEVNKRFKCEICQKGFTQRCYLKRHMNTHNNYRPFSCEFCNKKFTERGNLKQHLVVHTDIRPFKCTYCSKSFTHTSLLNKHMFHHTGEISTQAKSYTCKFCNRSFPFRHSLTRHVRKHTGERPFQCSTCKMTFKESGNLKRHEFVHTGGNFECDICSRKYVQKSSLQYHILNTHMMKRKKKKRKGMKKIL